MTAFYSDPLVTLRHGDCVQLMSEMYDECVDAVVTDPPYGLEFMGREWDGPKSWRSYDADGDKARHAPGRTAPLHTLSSPKYKAGHAFQAWCEQWGREALRVTKPGGYLLAFGGTRTHHRLVCALEDSGWIIRDELDWIYASGFPKGKANLKPAHEPIVLARKPGPLRPMGIDECRIETSDDLNGGTYSGERRSHGGEWQSEDRSNGKGTGFRNGVGEFVQPAGRWPSNVLLSDPELFDEPNPYVVGSGATQQSPGNYERQKGDWQHSSFELPIPDEQYGYGDSGGYSRFFIVPKADRTERERGLADRPKQQLKTMGDGAGEWSQHGPDNPNLQRANVHPTVKPIDLMRHLVRLVTPPGGTCLDPFLGSGTTALAASEEGFRCIGIERELEYLQIAKGRLMATPMGLGLDIPAPTRRDIGKQRGNRDSEGREGRVAAGDDLERIKDPEPLSEWELRWPFPFGDEDPAA
jgi:DNA modification methylase